MQDLSSSRYRNQLVEKGYRIGACKSLFVDSMETPTVEKKKISRKSRLIRAGMALNGRILMQQDEDRCEKLF